MKNKVFVIKVTVDIKDTIISVEPVEVVSLDTKRIVAKSVIKSIQRISFLQGDLDRIKSSCKNIIADSMPTISFFAVTSDESNIENLTKLLKKATLDKLVELGEGFIQIRNTFLKQAK